MNSLPCDLEGGQDFGGLPMVWKKPAMHRKKGANYQEGIGLYLPIRDRPLSQRCRPQVHIRE